MNSPAKPWAVLNLAKNTLPKKRRHWGIAIVTLALIFLVGLVATAKTITVEVAGQETKYITVRTTVEDFFKHTKLEVYPEDLVIPGRDAIIKNGLHVTVQHSVPITIKYEGKEISYRTLSPSIELALEGAGRKFGFHLKDSDEVQPSRETVITPNLAIEVKRAVPITVVADGTTKRIETVPGSVKQVLEKQNIVVGLKDLVTPESEQVISANDTIKIVRVTEGVQTVEAKLPFQVIAKKGDFPVGLPDQVVSQGAPGIDEQVVKVTYEDGVEVERTILAQKTLKKPVDQVVARGAQTSVTRGGATINFKRAIKVLATGYSDSGATTSLGVTVHKGVIAVDPRVIPYRSRMYVEGYGWGDALDTGGAIKGNRIDLYFESTQEALNWGKRSVIIYIQ